MNVLNLLRTFSHCIILLTLLSGTTIFACGQTGIYIGSLDSSYLQSEDSTGFFMNVEADGVFESAIGSDLIFLGESWQSNLTSKFPGDGRFTFQQPSSLGLDVNQKLGGVTWDNRFPNMILRNANDVNLTGVAGNRDTFTFDTGCIIHDLSDFVIGDGNPGVILGYSETGYFITNHNQNSDTGFLVRQNIGALPVDFPVGNAKMDYTPARISNAGDVDTFYIRVFPNVYQFGTNGDIVNDITVQRTWNIIEETAGGSSVDLTLQHNASTEGSNYSRSDQYVSRYFGQVNNAYRDTAGGDFWDYAATGNGYANSAGTITTGSNVGFEATRSRSITTSFSKNAPTRYFTKASTVMPIPVELIYLSASWINEEQDAEVVWGTASELNNRGFDVLRSYDALSWEPVGFVESNVSGGNTADKQDYSFLDKEIDPNERTVYYKLNQRDFDGNSEEYGPVILKRDNALVRLDIVAFPNPTKTQFYLNFEGEIQGTFKLELIDVLGQVVHTQRVEKSTYLESAQVNVNEVATGNYWIKIQSIDNPVMYINPVKIIIAR